MSYFVLRDLEFDSVEGVYETLGQASEHAVKLLHQFKSGPYRLERDRSPVVTLSWAEDPGEDEDRGRVVAEWHLPAARQPVATRFRFRP